MNANSPKANPRVGRLLELNAKLDSAIEFAYPQPEEPSTLSKIGKGAALAGLGLGGAYLGSALYRGRSMYKRGGLTGALKYGMAKNNRSIRGLFAPKAAV